MSPAQHSQAHTWRWQVHAMLSKLAEFTDIRLALVVGGLSLQSQATALRSNPEIVVATPVLIRLQPSFHEWSVRRSSLHSRGCPTCKAVMCTVPRLGPEGTPAVCLRACSSVTMCMVLQAVAADVRGELPVLPMLGCRCQTKLRRGKAGSP